MASALHDNPVFLRHLEDYVTNRQLNDCDNNDNQFHQSTNDIHKILEQKDRDLFLAAELGKALLLSNQELREKQEQLIEDFRQRIHEVEIEKSCLEAKLRAAEQDYGHHISEMQANITQLKRDLRSKDQNLSQTCDESRQQRRKLECLEDERDCLQNKLNENVQINENLRVEKELLAKELTAAKTTMKEHVKQMEQLHIEMRALYSEKRCLEQRLMLLTEEQEQLLSHIEKQKRQIEEMNDAEKITKNTIDEMRQDVIGLEDTAVLLQSRLDQLINRQNSWYLNATTDKQQQQQQQRPTNFHGELLGHHHEARETLADMAIGGGDNNEQDVDIEIDYADEHHQQQSDFITENLHAAQILVFNNGGVATADGCGGDAGAYDTQMDTNNTNNELGFVNSEIVEVHKELRDLYSRINCQRIMSKPGQTPDGLALIEMDFRLTSLRNLLTELNEVMECLSGSNKLSNQQSNDHNSQTNGYPADQDELMRALQEKSEQVHLNMESLRQLESHLSDYENKLSNAAPSFLEECRLAGEDNKMTLINQNGFHLENQQNFHNNDLWANVDDCDGIEFE